MHTVSRTVSWGIMLARAFLIEENHGVVYQQCECRDQLIEDNHCCELINLGVKGGVQI